MPTTKTAQKAASPAKSSTKDKPAARTAAKVAPVPEGFHTITPNIVVSDGEGAIALYQKALGAEVRNKMHMPGSKKIMHSCLQIGSSKLFLYDETPHMAAPKHGVGGSSFYLYVENVDERHKRALAAGMKETMAPADTFWGDRMSNVTCPYGHHWTFATHMRDVSPAEMTAAAAKLMPRT